MLKATDCLFRTVLVDVKVMSCGKSRTRLERWQRDSGSVDCSERRYAPPIIKRATSTPLSCHPTYDSSSRNILLHQAALRLCSFSSLREKQSLLGSLARLDRHGWSLYGVSISRLLIAGFSYEPLPNIAHFTLSHLPRFQMNLFSGPCATPPTP